MLLIGVWWRLLVAGMFVALLWAGVLWVVPSTPDTALVQPAARVAAATASVAPSPATVEPGRARAGGLRAVVRSGLPAPDGGRFDRFDAAAQPVVAPVNGNGQVAFYATVLHGAKREGIFLGDGEHVRSVAAFGDAVPGGGTLAEFGAHPLPALNSAGHVAFVARIGGGRATEGVFLAGDAGRLQTIAIAGDDAPGLPAGVMVGFDAPALNDNDELAFVANVRRGRDDLDVLYFWNGRRLQRVVAGGELLLRIGGVMDKIGGAALNNAGVIAFPATIYKGPTLGGIFVAGAENLRLLVGAGDHVPSGPMILRFSERIAIDDAGVVSFGAYIGDDASNIREALLRTEPEQLGEIAVQGAPAPGGGRYAGFGPWPTASPDGTVAFIAALDGGPGPLAVFTGSGANVTPAATTSETLPSGRGVIGPFATNAVAAAGPGGVVTFTTLAGEKGGENVIYCRCPAVAGR
jgi:hypothetical protein